MSKKVLIVDDDPKNLKLARDILQFKGYETFEAVDGKQALETALTVKPDLILMDVELPEMDGLSVTRILKSNEATKGIPVVALTSRAMEYDREEALEAGCDDYMAKPINTREFARKVVEWIDGAV
jgi:CheY-like chemotaxis protein